MLHPVNLFMSDEAIGGYSDEFCIEYLMTA